MRVASSTEADGTARRRTLRLVDTAVGLVQSYLYMNGYFTVTEYPVMELVADGEVRTVTDVDVLALRFPGAGRFDPGDSESRAVEPDPNLDVDPDRVDLIIGEVKEGRAELNRAARSPEVLRAALARFGRLDAESADRLVADLISSGEAIHPAGLRVRLLAFGSRPPHSDDGSHRWILLGDIATYMRRVMLDNWPGVAAIQSKDPVLSLMILLEKAARGE